MTTTVTMHIGDVRDVLEQLTEAGATFDHVVTSPPFLALRSYLPADHPDKHREIGSEPTPAAFLDTLYGLTAQLGELVPEWGSVCVELGDTMAGSSGGGGDYLPGGLREDQPGFGGSSARAREGNAAHWRQKQACKDEWPLAKSMCLMPHAYTIGLAYGHNPLTGQATPAGRWRIRNVICWARPNPPVGSLGKRNPVTRTGDYKFRPATSYITVACRGTGRFFDLDAVRTDNGNHEGPRLAYRHNVARHAAGLSSDGTFTGTNPAGAPPLDWHTDHLDGDWLYRFTQPHTQPTGRKKTIIRRNDPRRPLLSYITVACRGTGRFFDLDAVRTPHNPNNHRPDPALGLTEQQHKAAANPLRGDGPVTSNTGNPAGAPPLDWHTDHLDGDWLWKLATAPYPGSHYATYPLTLPRRLIQAMCPLRVCTVCGWPSERIIGTPEYHGLSSNGRTDKASSPYQTMRADGMTVPTLGWTDCGCVVTPRSAATAALLDRPIDRKWRPGHVLDPFGGSGTTAVAAALESRDATLIDIDRRNIDLVDERLRRELRVLNRTDNGDTITWTVDVVTATELAADRTGQLDLFGGDAA